MTKLMWFNLSVCVWPCYFQFWRGVSVGNLKFVILTHQIPQLWLWHLNIFENTTFCGLTMYLDHLVSMSSAFRVPSRSTRSPNAPCSLANASLAVSEVGSRALRASPATRSPPPPPRPLRPNQDLAICASPNQTTLPLLDGAFSFAFPYFSYFFTFFVHFLASLHL